VEVALRLHANRIGELIVVEVAIRSATRRAITGAD
jgi:hypothetical protein